MREGRWPTDRRSVWLFVRDRFDIRLPYVSFTPGHSTPLDFVVDALLHPGRDVAAWANRSGGKTLGASIIAAMEFAFCDGLSARVLSGSEDQARNLYRYWLGWVERLLAGRVEGRPGRAVTRVAGGSFEILAASQTKVRGPKIQRLFRDEIDETDGDVLDASIGMLASTDGLPARTVDTSTWHRPAGAMARLVAGAEQKGIRLHKWGIWESLEQCPPERHDNGRGCDACGLEAACRAKARQHHADPHRRIGIAAECEGLFRIDDAIKNFRRWSAARWAAEAECRRPSVEGLVYPEFDEQRHRCVSPPGDLTIYRTIDWGCGVFVCLWIGEDAGGTAYVLDTYRAEGGTVHQHARHIAGHGLSGVAETFCDPAGRNRNDQSGRSNVDVFREYGIHCTYTLAARAREVRNGVALVRAALDPADGTPRLLQVPTDGNRMFVTAMQSYHNRRINGIWIDSPADPQEFEHIPDALRYYFVNRQRHGIEVVGLGAR